MNEVEILRIHKMIHIESPLTGYRALLELLASQKCSKCDIAKAIIPLRLIEESMYPLQYWWIDDELTRVCITFLQQLVGTDRNVFGLFRNCRLIENLGDIMIHSKESINRENTVRNMAFNLICSIFGWQDADNAVFGEEVHWRVLLDIIYNLDDKPRLAAVRALHKLLHNQVPMNEHIINELTGMLTLPDIDTLREVVRIITRIIEYCISINSVDAIPNAAIQKILVSLMVMSDKQSILAILDALSLLCRSKYFCQVMLGTCVIDFKPLIDTVRDRDVNAKLHTLIRHIMSTEGPDRDRFCAIHSEPLKVIEKRMLATSN